MSGNHQTNEIVFGRSVLTFPLQIEIIHKIHGINTYPMVLIPIQEPSANNVDGIQQTQIEMSLRWSTRERNETTNFEWLYHLSQWAFI